MPLILSENFIEMANEWLMTHGIRILIVLIISIVVLLVSKRVIKHTVRAFVTKRSSKDALAAERRSETLHSIAYNTFKFIVLAVAGITILSELGISIAPLLGAAGIAGIAIGLGAQSIIKDILSGLFIISKDQYRRGDFVKIAGVSGIVGAVNIRDTILRDADGAEHHVTNSEIKTVSNYTKLWSRVNLDIPVTYSTNMEKAMDVLNKLGAEMAEEEQWKDDIIKPVQVVGVDDFTDSGIIIKILGDTKPMRQWDVMRELRKRIKLEFDKEGLALTPAHGKSDSKKK